MMKKRTKVILSIIAVFVLILGTVAFWQRNNIRAFFEFSTNSSNELASQITDSDKEMDALLEQISGLDLGQLTKEERDQLVSGALSFDDAAALVLERSTGQQSTAEDGTNDGTDDDATAEINQLVAEFYVLKAQYMGTLNGLVAAAESEFYALPASQRNQSTKMSVVSKYMSQAYALEGQCDSQVNALLEQIKTLLKESGGDLSLVSSLKGTYATEKARAKAYYLSLI